MSRKYPKVQKVRNIFAAGLASKQFKPQTIRLKHRDLLADLLDDFDLEDDNLLDPDWDL